MTVVVIVDDQESAREMMRLLVKGIDESIEVKEFWDAEIALDWCCSNSPQLVLLDYRMPSLDGITFAERLRENSSGELLAIMMITSQGDSSIRLAALQAGIVEFVTKPIVPQEIKLRIRNILELTAVRQVGITALPVLATRIDRWATLSVIGKMLSTLRLKRIGYSHDVVSVDHVMEAMATYMQMSPDGVEKAIAAAKVYDIGMMLLPDNAVELDRELSDDEREYMQSHVVEGRDLLLDIDVEIAEIVYRHHENFNGSGYPNGLIGLAIPAISRMLAVADTFCSLVSKRPHRDAMRISEAVGLISSQSGTRYDPSCVEALVDSLPGILGKTQSMPIRDFVEIGGQIR